MKICFINPADSPRSEVFDLSYQLNRKGHEVTILYPSRDISLEGKGNVKTVPFPARFLPKIHYTGPSFLREYQLIHSLVRDEGYDIVQVCDYDYLTSIPPIFLKRKLGVPVIVTTDAFPGISWRWGNTIVDSAAKLYTKTLGRFVLNSCDKLVVLHSSLFQDALSLGVSPSKVSVMPNGVDFEQFNLDLDSSTIRRKLHIEDGQKVLLFVGRLSLVKRVDMLIEVTKKLLSQGFNIKTVIVGDGEFRDKYEKLATPIKGNVTFTGRIHHKELSKYYAIGDIFVLPSLSEGLPTVLLEAAAFAKPIVASKVGGIPDIIVHGHSGLLADSV